MITTLGPTLHYNILQIILFCVSLIQQCLAGYLEQCHYSKHGLIPMAWVGGNQRPQVDSRSNGVELLLEPDQQKEMVQVLDAPGTDGDWHLQLHTCVDI